MTWRAAWPLALLLLAPAPGGWAQDHAPASVPPVEGDIPGPPGEEEETPGRALPTATPQPEPDPPESESTEESRVLRRGGPATQPVSRPVTRPRYDKSLVRRGPDGKVVVPVAPRAMPDPVRPRAADLTPPERAGLTGLQVALGVFPGVLMTGAALALAPVLLTCAVCSPWYGVTCTGLAWSAAVVPHAVLSAVALWFPTWAYESDPLAGLAAAAAVLAVDVSTVLVGGVTGLAILLRWPRSPTQTYVHNRTVVPLPIPELRGVDVALVGNFLVAAGVAAFVAPLAGVVAYTVVSYLRGIPEEEPLRARLAARQKAAQAAREGGVR